MYSGSAELPEQGLSGCVFTRKGIVWIAKQVAKCFPCTKLVLLCADRNPKTFALSLRATYAVQLHASHVAYAKAQLVCNTIIVAAEVTAFPKDYSQSLTYIE